MTTAVPPRMAGSSPPDAPQSHAGQRTRQRGGGIDVLDEDVRRVACQHVPQHAAAHGGGQAQDTHAEEIHVLLHSRHGPGGREGQGARQLQHQKCQIHGAVLTGPRTGPSP